MVRAYREIREIKKVCPDHPPNNHIIGRGRRDKDAPDVVRGRLHPHSPSEPDPNVVKTDKVVKTDRVAPSPMVVGVLAFKPRSTGG